MYFVHPAPPAGGLPAFDEDERGAVHLSDELCGARPWNAERAGEVAQAWAEEHFSEDRPQDCEWYTLLVWPAGLPQRAFVVALERPVAYEVTATQAQPLHDGWEYQRPGYFPDLSCFPPDPGDDEDTKWEYAMNLRSARGALILALEERSGYARPTPAPLRLH